MSRARGVVCEVGSDGSSFVRANRLMEWTGTRNRRDALTEGRHSGD